MGAEGVGDANNAAAPDALAPPLRKLGRDSAALENASYHFAYGRTHYENGKLPEARGESVRRSVSADCGSALEASATSTGWA